jgi:DNA-binding FadR family transcriptional regulator
VLKPLPPRDGAAKSCASVVRAAILRGEFAVGSRLPPERALATMLHVNRATVRTALRELEASGLLTVRQGSGYAVQDYRTTGGPDLVSALVDLARTGADVAEIVADVLAVRRHLARAVLERLAARPLRRADAAAILERVDVLEDHAREGADPVTLAAADLAVLGALLDATRSPVLRLFFNPAASVLVSIPGLAAAMYASPNDNVASWRILVAALVSGKIDVDGVVAGVALHDERTVARLARNAKDARR